MKPLLISIDATDYAYIKMANREPFLKNFVEASMELIINYEVAMFYVNKVFWRF